MGWRVKACHDRKKGVIIGKQIDYDGTKFILEMQNCPQRYFFNRGFYYICRMVSRQAEIGSDWKYDLLPVYGIYLLNFSLPEFQHWRTDVVLANEATGKAFGEVKLKQIYLSSENSLRSNSAASCRFVFPLRLTLTR